MNKNESEIIMRTICISILLLSLLSMSACSGPEPETKSPETPVVEGSTVNPSLLEVMPEFEKKVYKVTEGVYQAVGFAAANSIMIEGDDGLIIVDASGSVEKGAEIRAAFADISDKPIVAIIYTHNHGDHVFGGYGFVPDGKVDVYSHETTDYYIDRVVNLVAPAIGRRSSTMIGSLLPVSDEGYVHYGVGPFVESAMPGQHPKVLRPTHTFKDELDVTIAGVQIRLIHAPGETDDQLFVWLPEKKVLMPGDNVYKSFPNLYTLRGTHYRDVATWYKSIDAMLAFDPEFLAPSHTLPVSGKEEIKNILTTYRDAIQFVHDQTLRGINQGLTPDELVEVVKLPDHLRNHPYLQEYYGSVEWSVRSIFSGYMGWYDGNVADLYPPTLSARAEKMAKLAGGEEQLLAAAQQAVSDGDYAWALQLSDHLMRLQPDSESVQQLRADAARAMGFAAHNANARNVYLTEAFLLEGKADFDEEAMREISYDLIKAMPIKSFVESMGINLNPEYSLDREETLALVFTDVNESFSIHVRHGVAIISEGPVSEAENTMTTTSDIWLDIMAGKISLPGALATGDIQLEGGRLRIPSVLSFLSMFRS